jgi:acyl CoA:acetate/3-ketoacid CoA transferase beta subunit
VPPAGHGKVTSGDATQEDIVMGGIGIPEVHASHAPLDTIVQAGIKVMAIEN